MGYLTQDLQGSLLLRKLRRGKIVRIKWIRNRLIIVDT